MLGMAYRYARHKGWVQVSALRLLAFGLIVHVVEVLLFIQLSDDPVHKVERRRRV